MHGTAAMGRKKLIVAREPNGRIQREHDYSAAHIRRLRDLAIRGFADPIWGSELGRLFMEKSITGEMLEAGRRWARDSEAYRRSIGMFPVRGAAVDAKISAGRPPTSGEDEKLNQRAREAAEAYFEADAILTAAGIGAYDAVRRVCEDDECLCGLGDLMLLRLGLARLAVHYGLTNHGKSGRNVR